MRDEIFQTALLEMLEKKPHVHAVHGLMRKLRQHSAAESLLELGFDGPDSPIME